MSISRHSSALHLSLLFPGLLLLAACDDDSGSLVGTDEQPAAAVVASTDETPPVMAMAAGNADLGAGLATFREATARYHRVEAAIADGFVQILPCLANPAGEGAIGIPYANLDRFDGVIDLSEPEILFYEPQQDGTLRLVGGEPVVPIEAWTGGEPPSLFGHEFHRNEEHGLYGLHMWVWRHSPDGVFSFWNDNVTCESADQ